MALLGSVLRDPGEADKTFAMVEESEFAINAHQRIYRGMRDLHDAGKPIDLTALLEPLATYLEKTKQLDDVGSYPYLVKLYESVATGANADYYAGVVRETAARRALANFCSVMARKAAEPGSDLQELLGETEQTLYRLSNRQRTSGVYHLAERLADSMERYDGRSEGARNGKRVSGLTTGYEDLDHKFRMEPGALILFAARPSMGKTSLGTNVCI